MNPLNTIHNAAEEDRIACLEFKYDAIQEHRMSAKWKGKRHSRDKMERGAEKKIQDFRKSVADCTCLWSIGFIGRSLCNQLGNLGAFVVDAELQEGQDRRLVHG